MLGRTAGLAAVCAVGASAFILPPGIAPAKDNEASVLDAIAVNPLNQVITVPCSECAFPSTTASAKDGEEGDDMFWIQGGMQDALLLNFTISDNNKGLQLNGDWIYPFRRFDGKLDRRQPRVKAFPSQADVAEIESGAVQTTDLFVTSFFVDNEVEQRITDDDVVVSVKVGILDLNDEAMTIDPVEVKLLQTGSGDLLILQVQQIAMATVYSNDELNALRHPHHFPRPDFKDLAEDGEFVPSPPPHGPRPHFDGEEHRGPKPHHPEGKDHHGPKPHHPEGEEHHGPKPHHPEGKEHHGPKPHHPDGKEHHGPESHHTGDKEHHGPGSHHFDGEEHHGPKPPHFRPHGGPNGHKQKECKVLPHALCQLRNALEDKIDQFTSRPDHFRGQGAPCPGARKAHGKHLPGHKKPHFDKTAEEGDEPRQHHGRPHHVRPHGHHHRGPAGFARRFLRVFAKGLVAFLIPVMAGVAGGMTVSLVGLLVGRMVGYLWIKMFRGGRRGQASVALPEDAVYPEETKAMLAEMESPPVYEDTPAYEEKESAEH